MTTQYRKPLSDRAIAPVAKAHCCSHTLSCTSENNFARRLKSPSPLSAARQTTPTDPKPVVAGGPGHAPEAQLLKPRISLYNAYKCRSPFLLYSNDEPKSTLYIILTYPRTLSFLGTVQLRSNIVRAQIQLWEARFWSLGR